VSQCYTPPEMRVQQLQRSRRHDATVRECQLQEHPSSDCSGDDQAAGPTAEQRHDEGWGWQLRCEEYATPSPLNSVASVLRGSQPRGSGDGCCSADERRGSD